MLWLAVRTARTHRVVSFCILWFFGNLVIESSVVALEILFEHRTYLPSVGVFLLIASLSRQYVAQPWLRRGALSAVVMLFAVWTQERVITWSDSVALYRDVVAKAPDLPRGHLNLAIYLARTGDRAGAIEHMLEVVRLYPPHFDAHYALGQQFALDERFEEAEDHFLEATRINPESAAAYAALGGMLVNEGTFAEAVDPLTRALEIDPTLAVAHYNLGVASFGLGKSEEAATHYEETLPIECDSGKSCSRLSLEG